MGVSEEMNQHIRNSVRVSGAMDSFPRLECDYVLHKSIAFVPVIDSAR